MLLSLPVIIPPAVPLSKQDSFRKSWGALHIFRCEFKNFSFLFVSYVWCVKGGGGLTAPCVQYRHGDSQNAVLGCNLESMLRIHPPRTPSSSCPTLSLAHYHAGTRPLCKRWTRQQFWQWNSIGGACTVPVLAYESSYKPPALNCFWTVLRYRQGDDAIGETIQAVPFKALAGAMPSSVLPKGQQQTGAFVIVDGRG